MSIFIWIVAIYLLSIAITFPFIKVGAKWEDGEDKTINPFWAARIISCVPIINLFVGVRYFFIWKRAKLLERRLKKMADSHRKKNPDIAAGLDTVVKAFKKLNKLNDE